MSERAPRLPTSLTRPKVLTPRSSPRATAVANDAAPAFTLTTAALTALVSEAVQGALEAHRQAPLLVDKQVLAKRLACSAAHVDNLRKRGLPVVMVGDAVRFEPAAVLEWLRGEQGGETGGEL